MFFLMIVSIPVLAQESYNSLLYKGNSEFNKKNYEKSSSKFLDAVKSKENDFGAHYNLGNSFYKRKMYDEARVEFEKADKFADNLADKTAAQYNLGNTYMETQNPDKAAEHYKAALKQDPNNEAAQRNYQIAKLKQKEKENKKNQQNKDGGKGGDQKDNKDKSGKGNTPSEEKGEGDKKIQGKGPDGKDKQDDADNKIPKDLEKAILERSENKERETARRILNKNADAMPQSNEKDW